MMSEEMAEAMFKYPFISVSLIIHIITYPFIEIQRENGSSFEAKVKESANLQTKKNIWSSSKRETITPFIGNALKNQTQTRECRLSRGE